MALYEKYLSDQDEVSFGAGVKRHYTPATLQRLAQGGDRYRRRAAVLALGLLGDYESNHVIGCALMDQDRGVRMLAEDAISAIWQRAGNQLQRSRLRRVVELNDAGRSREALSKATELIEQAPWFAEAWNQRGSAYFRLEKYNDAIRDWRQALEINPYHYRAASGMGQCYLKLNDAVSALECFRRALRLNPNLERERAQVAVLEKSLKDKK